MKIMTYQVPGISRIFCCNTQELHRNIREAAAAGIPALISAKLTEIPFKASPKASTEIKIAASGSSEKSTLQFVTDESINFDRSLAFIILGADGQARIMGSYEPPFPVIEIKNNLSSPGEGTRGREVSVTWSADFIYCAAAF